MTAAQVLVLGSTGYVGGRLVPLLLERGHRVRAAGRSVEKIHARSWGDKVEAVQADMHDLESLKKAAEGCDACFYLVHSMTKPGRDFAEQERDAAYNMVKAATHANLKRIIYLGGLGEDREDHPLSKHLRSRAEVGRILTLGPAEVTTLRAAQIIGSGSSSFELVRYLADRLPVMITPAWVRTRTQPIAIRNVLDYLAGCLENDATAGLTLDIGGPDILSYEELFHLYSEVAGIPRRRLLPLPFVSPRLSSFWVSLITPVPMPLSRALIEGLRNEVICRDERIRDLVPQELLSCRESIRRALEKTKQQTVETCLFDVGSACMPEWASADDPHYAGGTRFEMGYKARLQGDPKKVWEQVARIGGEHGWYFGDPLWRLRGFIDRLLAGPGMHRGRPHGDDTPHVGDALDFWRVIASDEGRRLLLLAEMRLPGEALLEFRMDSQWDNAVDLSMTAKFLPRGLTGILYWYAMYPFHVLLFKNIIENISDLAGTILYEPARRVR
ncbi:SDR family oxidoreductase [Pseudodesulfovibrio thermohalotolerans]|uniref:SDR family oxidoreductase n=1 Tax=Pseudodesulfovibrio thermohalotolerans TaxID=2880651 RepID=UPI002442C10E|nr:SDR family oxidoreductase [Pseudodesulfovibrio thermohalotolerans]WFS62551.1 SDR family oxidoreductase [Pseudodesulfovibrio thermohalotolerans]